MMEPNFKWATEETFDTFTIEQCEEIFEKLDLEQSVDKLTILRLCIQLLDRLETTTNYVFAGKVLVFLAKVIPLFDQSGLNIRSEFNSRELPQKVLDSLNSKRGQNDVDIEEGEAMSDEETDDSDKVFERFWKTQSILGKPNLLHDKTMWFSFRSNVDLVITKLENTPIKTKIWDTRTSYMTSSRSLALQLMDINMRRCFLMQILIVLQFLEQPADSRPDSFTTEKINITWLQNITRRVLALLESMPSPEEGRKFTSFIKHILKREEMWSKWKSEERNKKPARIETMANGNDEDDFVNMKGTYQKRRKISDELSAASGNGMLVIGSQDMFRLWNRPPGQKASSPELADYLNVPTEKQGDTFKDPNYSFRALRLLRKSPHFFGPSSATIQSIDDYLKCAASRLCSGNIH